MKFLLNLIPVWGVVALLTVVGVLTDAIPTASGPAGGFLIAICVVIALFGIISTFTSVFSHIDDLGRLNRYKQDITACEDNLKAVRTNIKIVTDVATDLDDALLAKSNVDHPIVKAMHTLNSSQSDVKKAKENLNYVKGKIHARKLGPFGWVVSLYGDGEG